jgi:excisionase family DNA binding protein
MAVAASRKTEVLRRSEAARRLGVHPNTLAGWVKRGWLKGIEMPGGETRFREDEVEQLRERIYGG